jgi:hypothetical protein
MKIQPFGLFFQQPHGLKSRIFITAKRLEKPDFHNRQTA